MIEAAEVSRRLRVEGENALRQHLSLGMWKLCAEAAAVIDFLASEVTRLERRR